jgi:hypothetical protein
MLSSRPGRLKNSPAHESIATSTCGASEPFRLLQTVNIGLDCRRDQSVRRLMDYPRPIDAAAAGDAEDHLLTFLADLLEAAIEEVALPSAPTRASAISALCRDAMGIAEAIDIVRRRTNK